MRILNFTRESDIVFLDIETAREEKKLTKKSKMYEAWLYKTRYQNEVEQKTGEEFDPIAYYNEKAALYAPFAKVVCVVAGRIKDDKLNVKVYDGTGGGNALDLPEQALLRELAQDLTKIYEANGETVMCGFNNLGFDQPFLAKRMLIHGVKIPMLLDNAHLKPWDVKAIDLAQLWKNGSFYPDSLMAVAAAMGLESPKQSLSGSEVSDAYHAGKLGTIIDYCKGDVLTTANIYRRFAGKKLVSYS